MTIKDGAKFGIGFTASLILTATTISVVAKGICEILESAEKKSENNNDVKSE